MQLSCRKSAVLKKYIIFIAGTFVKLISAETSRGVQILEDKR